MVGENHAASRISEDAAAALMRIRLCIAHLPHSVPVGTSQYKLASLNGTLSANEDEDSHWEDASKMLHAVFGYSQGRTRVELQTIVRQDRLGMDCFLGWMEMVLPLLSSGYQNLLCIRVKDFIDAATELS
jgi:hypothetical protein